MPKHTLNFTKRALEMISAAPKGKRLYYNDTKISGLQLAVTGTGTKTFVFYRKIRGKPTRVTLGRYPDLTPEQARRKADIVRGQIAMGDHPNELKKADRAHSITLAEAFMAFLKVRSLKPKTVYDYERVMQVAFPDWQAKRLADINKDLVSQRFRCITQEHGEAYANLAMRCLRSVWNFTTAQFEDGEGNPLLPQNPVQRLSQTRQWHKLKRRTTVIKAAQLPAWFEAVQTLRQQPAQSMAARVADYLLLVLFTGLRRKEAATLTWSMVDLQHKTLTVEDTKNEERHILPLSDFLVELLHARMAHAEGDFVFPGNGKAGYLIEPRAQMAKVTQVSGVSFTLHDLRRTFITVAESLDIPAYALKRLLNHKMANDVTAGYIVTDVERLRTPMQQITDYLLRVAGLKPDAMIVNIHDAMSG